MTNRNYKLLIITPLFFNNASGASVYYQQLVSLLDCQGYKITVISDKERGKLNGVAYHPFFPVRSGVNKRRIIDIISYTIQNFQYIKIDGIIEETKPDVILVHSSFYNYPGFFSYFMKRMLSKYYNIKWILDVRDHLMPPNKVLQFNNYNKIIACSENIIIFLRKHGIAKKKLEYIPVLQENLGNIECWENNDSLVNYLRNKTYILYIGAVKKEKGVLLLLKSFSKIVSPQFLSCQLVLIGLLKDTDRELKEMLLHESVIYAGVRSRDVIYSLIGMASLCVNLSPIEGMPRASLEALASKRPTLLPPNIPEFNRYCSEFVASDNDPVRVGEQMLSILRSQKVADYPIEQHSVENIFHRYEEVLFSK